MGRSLVALLTCYILSFIFKPKNYRQKQRKHFAASNTAGFCCQSAGRTAAPTTKTDSAAETLPYHWNRSAAKADHKRQNYFLTTKVTQAPKATAP